MTDRDAKRLANVERLIRTAIEVDVLEVGTASAELHQALAEVHLMMDAPVGGAERSPFPESSSSSSAVQPPKEGNA